MTYGTVALAIFTFFLFIFTAFLWFTTRELARDAKTSSGQAVRISDAAALAYQQAERAYVKMSHRPPGMNFVSATGDRQDCFARVDLEIKNWGNTPATITKTYARFVIAASSEVPPPAPDYRESENKFPFGEAFLVKDESIFAGLESPLREIDLKNIERGDWLIHVFGYVDYTDIFQKHRRGGYARVFSRIIDDAAHKSGKWEGRNNLVLVPFDGYNYDRERDKDNEAENHDWPKKA